MDEDLRNGVKATRWLAWATAGLLVLGVASAGAVGAHNRSEDRRIVTAAGENASGVDAPSTTETVVTVPAPTTVAPTTTAPAPATTTTAKPAATTTAPPTTKAPARTTTTAATAATTPSTSPTSATNPTTVTTISGHATVTLANEFTAAFTLTINGRVFTLQPGQQIGPVDLTLAPDGNDVVELRAVSDPQCGIGDAGGYFVAGGRYRMAIVAGPPGTSCAGIGSFRLTTTAI